MCVSHLLECIFLSIIIMYKIGYAILWCGYIWNKCKKKNGVGTYKEVHIK